MVTHRFSGIKPLEAKITLSRRSQVCEEGIAEPRKKWVGGDKRSWCLIALAKRIFCPASGFYPQLARRAIENLGEIFF